MKKFFKRVISFIIIVASLCALGFIAYQNRSLFLPSYSVTFCSENVVLTEYDKSIMKFDKLTLPKIEREGYEFKGWYFGDTLWTNDMRVQEEMELVAKWEAKEYEITFIVNSTTHTQKAKYDSMPTFTGSTEKPSTESKDYIFSGWQPSLSVVKGNETYTAQYLEIDKSQAEECTVLFIVDDMPLLENTLTINKGNQIAYPNINSSDYGMGGYEVGTWFTNSSKSNTATFPLTINSNTTLYSSWEYILDNGFYPYLTKFNSANNYTGINIYSHSELVAWVEYVEFNNITQKYNLNLTYSFSGGIMTELEKAVNESVYPSNSTIHYGTSGSHACIYISDSGRQYETQLKTAETKDGYTQQQSAQLIKNSTTRPSDFADFNINNVKQSIQVSTSNQLVYALEKGLQPNCKANSQAEKVYTEAKNVLKEICNDSMNEIDKTRAIYEWLIMNVQYDNVSANNQTILNDWVQYEAWYAEGVFFNKNAVCDGIAKAFVILAQIENIATIRVTGNNHAWNKVFIGGDWYGVDATQGNLLITNEKLEILTYTNFLFTDSFKTAQGYTADNYQNIDATKTFNYYDYADYSTFDLYITSKNEFVNLLNSIKSITQTTTYLTIEIAISNTLAISNLTNYGYQQTGVSAHALINPITNSNGLKTYCLFIAK